MSLRAWVLIGLLTLGGDLPRLAAQEAGAGAAAKAVHTLKKGPLKIDVSLTGVFEARQMTPISLAGYFFYYGHYYAALCIEQLSPGERPRHQAQLATILLKLQEKDGSWWDYPLYNYHQQYGTAFVLMSLKRCRTAAAK